MSRLTIPQWIGLIAGTIGILAFCINEFVVKPEREAFVAEEARQLQVDWLELDKAWSADILDQLAQVNEKLDILMIENEDLREALQELEDGQDQIISEGYSRFVDLLEASDHD